jgi:hypothetical protein
LLGQQGKPVEEPGPGGDLPLQSRKNHDLIFRIDEPLAWYLVQLRSSHNLEQDRIKPRNLYLLRKSLDLPEVRIGHG